MYATSTEASKQPMSTIKSFLKFREILYPKNQEHIWENDLPAEYRVNKPLVQSLNESWNQQEKSKRASYLQQI